MAPAEVSEKAWTIPGARYKTKIDHVIPLTEAARGAIERLPKIAGATFVFSGDGKRAFSGYSKAKARFDKACGVTGWTLHDLRRTARSLMSRAGVNADIAERCLGHVISGVRGTYDRHAYFDEKKQALEALAALIGRIVSPPAGNVVSIEAARK
jgi:integrase